MTKRIKPVNLPAKLLATPRYRKRIVRNRKRYTRKGKQRYNHRKGK